MSESERAGWERWGDGWRLELANGAVLVRPSDGGFVSLKVAGDAGGGSTATVSAGAFAALQRLPVLAGGAAGVLEREGLLERIAELQPQNADLLDAWKKTQAIVARALGRPEGSWPGIEGVAALERENAALRARLAALEASPAVRLPLRSPARAHDLRRDIFVSALAGVADCYPDDGGNGRLAGELVALALEVARVGAGAFEPGSRDVAGDVEDFERSMAWLGAAEAPPVVRRDVTPEKGDAAEAPTAPRRPSAFETVGRFLGLPFRLQRGILLELGVCDDADDALPDEKALSAAVDRLKERGLVDAFLGRVEAEWAKRGEGGDRG